MFFVKKSPLWGAKNAADGVRGMLQFFGYQTLNRNHSPSISIRSKSNIQ